MKSFLPILFLCLNTAFCSGAQDLQEIYEAGLQAYKQKEYAMFLKHMQQADSLRSGHHLILQNLAKAQALNQLPEKAIKTLNGVIYMNANIDLQDEDFSSLREKASYKELLAQANLLKASVQKSKVFIELADKTLHPEGMAFHKESGSFYVGSVHQRKILKIDADKQVSVFYEGNALFAIMGMAVDQQRDLLWVCSTAVPQMQGYTEALAGKAAVLCFDIATKELLGTFPVEDSAAWLGDLAIAPNGTVYSTSGSTAHPAIYKVNRAKEITEEWLYLDELISLQGISFKPNGEQFYITDYRYGLFLVDVKSKSLKKLTNETLHPLKGIDGLYFYHNHLIAICNGLQPYQVVQFQLNEQGNSITNLEYLDKALPEMNEPTLGVISQDELYYIANSPWSAYSGNMQQIPEKLQQPLILKIKL